MRELIPGTGRAEPRVPPWGGADPEVPQRCSGRPGANPGFHTGAEGARSNDAVRVDLDWLETFLAVVDRGGFSAASEQIHRSQSRVSAHIAALERELGLQLIDRARRPAAVTPAGALLVEHARRILAGVDTARSALAAFRLAGEQSVTVLTTPCIAPVVFPGVLADLLAQHPEGRVSILEQGWQEHPSPDGGRPGERSALAVVPTRTQPPPAGLHEHLLWREPFRVVVQADHLLARRGGPVSPERLSGERLVIGGAPGEADPEVVAMLRERGVKVAARTGVDAPQTAMAMIRRGVGIGVLNAIALLGCDTTGLTVLDLSDPEMVREVAAYWYDDLLEHQLGRSLHRIVLRAPVPGPALDLRQVA